MNILLINHYAGSPELGMEFRPYYMAKEWVKAGHQVLIVGGSFSHLRKVQPQGKEDLIEGIHYRWVKLNAYKGNGIGRIRSMFSFVSKLWCTAPEVYHEQDLFRIFECSDCFFYLSVGYLSGLSNCKAF